MSFYCSRIEWNWLGTHWWNWRFMYLWESKRDAGEWRYNNICVVSCVDLGFRRRSTCAFVRSYVASFLLLPSLLCCCAPSPPPPLPQDYWGRAPELPSDTLKERTMKKLKLSKRWNNKISWRIKNGIEQMKLILKGMFFCTLLCFQTLSVLPDTPDFFFFYFHPKALSCDKVLFLSFSLFLCTCAALRYRANAVIERNVEVIILVGACLD